MKQQDMEKALTSLQAVAKELGLDEFEEFTIKGAGGLMVAQGVTRGTDYYKETVVRFYFDGRPFDPSTLSIDERRQWVNTLVNQAGQTQVDTALFLDVSQTLISKDLKALRGE